MKKIITLIILLVSSGVFAQSKVAEKVTELEKLNTRFVPFSIFSQVNEVPDSDVSKAVTKATFARIKTQSVNDIVANKYDAIDIEIPYEGNIIPVRLYKVNIFNEHFHVDTDKAVDVAYEKGVHYRGIIKGNVNSVASFNFFRNEVNGIVSGEGINNLVVGKLEKANNTTDYIIYSDADMKALNDFDCHMKADKETPAETTGEESRSVLSDRCVTMYFEIDHNIFLQKQSDVTNTTNWMTSVFNNVQTLYNNDGITVSLKSMYIWTEEDPYTGDGSSAYLAMFHDVRPVFDGDVGQLVGIDPGGLGGVAVTINGLCTQNNYSYSDVNITFSTVPTYSWTVQVITHEMGHLLGSRHTHACVWNGNNTSIDGCGTQAGFTEGECVQGPIPNGTVKGTIMSYCHLISGVGINFNNGFGTQPKAAILSAVNGALCLSTDCVNTCINMVRDVTFTETTNTSATVSWSDDSGATSWQVAVLPFSSSINNWVTVNEPTYIIPATLNANSYYKIRIRPLCGGGLTSIFRETLFATAASWCSGVVITDTGGIGGNYANMQSYVRTLIPDQADKAIKLQFTTFNLEDGFDFLYIYNGSNTAAEDLSAGGFTGIGLPTPNTITSTATDGSLTLRFTSDQGVVATGYAINVSCEEHLGTPNVNPGIDFTYYPNPATNQVTINSKTEMSELTVYNIEGRLLYQNKINALDTNVDISAFSTGTYFFKLKFGEKQVNFKILKM